MEETELRSLTFLRCRERDLGHNAKIYVKQKRSQHEKTTEREVEIKKIKMRESRGTGEGKKEEDNAEEGEFSQFFHNG